MRIARHRIAGFHGRKPVVSGNTRKLVMFDIVALPALADNYIWLLCGKARAVAVDPGDAGVVERALADRALALDGILLTHHHADHTGGVPDLVRAHGCRVWGPAREHIPGVTDPLDGGGVVTVLGQTLHVIAVPGHTAGHLAYWCPPAHALFCGDTLFAAGCGRLFEGSPGQMWDSLQKLAALPPDTRVYCAHEYTAANLRYARHVTPDDPALARRAADVDALRAAGRPSLPSTLAEETATNPYLRCREPAMAARALALLADPAVAQRMARWPALTGPARTFAVLRAAKDLFL